jgi:hypothetical protein
MRPVTSERTTMKKDNIVFALYIASSVAITVHAGVETYKTFKRSKPLRDQIKAAKKNN